MAASTLALRRRVADAKSVLKGVQKIASVIVDENVSKVKAVSSAVMPSERSQRKQHESAVARPCLDQVTSQNQGEEASTRHTNAVTSNPAVVGRTDAADETKPNLASPIGTDSLHRDAPQPVQTEHTATAAGSDSSPQTAEAGPAARASRREKLSKLKKTQTVPASSLSRLIGFGGLAVGVAAGALREATTRVFVPPKADESLGSVFVTAANAERLARTLSRMRGAALKLGQMLSIQDESYVPKPILEALERVRKDADVMPPSQLDAVMRQEIGEDWKSKFSSFPDEAMAAASIGQVHQAITAHGIDVAVKVQYPGVAESIGSDLKNLKNLLQLTNAIPEGFYVDDALRYGQMELEMECDYLNEANNQMRMFEAIKAATHPSSGTPLAGHDYHVPVVLEDLSGVRVLTSTFAKGVPLDELMECSQRVRDHVANLILRLTLYELFELRFMQTDPNFSNFLYDQDNARLTLIDFGASRDFSEDFSTHYLNMVCACAEGNDEDVLSEGKYLGFLTGDESHSMKEAFVQAGLAVGLPFASEGSFDFNTKEITSRVGRLGPTLLKERLKPPPVESYALHRKLSGCFLMCIKLRARVSARDMLRATAKRVLGKELK